MAWIESHTVLMRHKKLTELAKELRLKPVYLLGHLHALWHATIEEREDGDLTNWSDESIAESAGFLSDAPLFVRLLQKHGWLDGKLLHDWLDYSGRYLEAKYRTSNPEKLALIWRKHGREWGSPTKVRPNKITSPNQPTNPIPFADFWAVYPKRVGKAVAEVAWAKIGAEKALFERMKATLEAQKKSPEWLKDGGVFIPHPSTWLNQRRWEDEINKPLIEVRKIAAEDEKKKWIKEGKCENCGKELIVFQEEKLKVCQRCGISVPLK